MGKQVVVIASGEHERRVVPHLVRHLQAAGATLADVRIPPRNKTLDVDMAKRLIESAWYERIHAPPDKFVILIDVDGKVPADVLTPFQDQLPGRLGAKITAALQFAFAQWHLEAWFFADAAGLRAYLGGALGNVDASAPDSIQNPKGHLKNLLNPRLYTTVISEQIARSLEPQRIAQRSPSFQGLLNAIRNGSAG